jgi:hypothetical protein
MDRTRNEMLPFVESVIGTPCTTSRTTLDPDGMETPLDPCIDSLSFAKYLSPGLADVQMRPATSAVARVPAGMRPEREGAGAELVLLRVDGLFAAVPDRGTSFTAAGCPGCGRSDKSRIAVVSLAGSYSLLPGPQAAVPIRSAATARM